MLWPRTVLNAGKRQKDTNVDKNEHNNCGRTLLKMTENVGMNFRLIRLSLRSPALLECASDSLCRRLAAQAKDRNLCRDNTATAWTAMARIAMANRKLFGDKNMTNTIAIRAVATAPKPCPNAAYIAHSPGTADAEVKTTGMSKTDMIVMHPTNTSKVINAHSCPWPTRATVGKATPKMIATKLRKDSSRREKSSLAGKHANAAVPTKNDNAKMLCA